MNAPWKIFLQVVLGFTVWVWLLLPAMAGGDKYSPYGNPFTWVRIGPVQVKAEVVQSPEKLYQGLSHRKNLPAGRGMLFLMPETAVQTFCMRGMQFPIDIIWIAHGKVAGLNKNVSPQFPGTLRSPEAVNFVLEVPGGVADKHGIKVGDPVNW